MSPILLQQIVLHTPSSTAMQHAVYIEYLRSVNIQEFSRNKHFDDKLLAYVVAIVADVHEQHTHDTQTHACTNAPMHAYLGDELLANATVAVADVHKTETPTRMRK